MDATTLPYNFPYSIWIVNGQESEIERIRKKRKRKINIRNYGSNRLCICDGMDERLPHEVARTRTTIRNQITISQ